MLDALHSDVLLELLSWCGPADVQAVAQTCRRLGAFVHSFRAHLPRYTTACSITLLDGRRMRVRLRQSSPTRFAPAAAKKVVLVGKLEFVSLRNLDLRDVGERTWRSLLNLCSSRSRFSCVNCPFARLSRLYELYDRLPRLEYLNESYSTIDEEDVEEAEISRTNRLLVEWIAEDDIQAVDLGSLRDADGGFLFDLISQWVHSKTPNEFSHLCLRKTGENLRSRLLAHENAEEVAGMIAYRNHFHHDLCLLVDVQQRLFVNLAMASDPKEPNLPGPLVRQPPRLRAKGRRCVHKFAVHTNGKQLLFASQPFLDSFFEAENFGPVKIAVHGHDTIVLTRNMSFCISGRCWSGITREAVAHKFAWTAAEELSWRWQHPIPTYSTVSHGVRVLFGLSNPEQW
ncbi:hypothetical protein M3Y99_00854700 [Aphelenchoides fujianensis]|nr:hypothetical protein M3Y99_00854700 [Aphelenchoides fujianensis]